MDQEDQTPINEAPLPTTPVNPPIHKKISALLFLEIGILEVLFVLFGLILIFGTLNYFNVFKISSSIPLLSFLPTQGEFIENKTQAEVVVSTTEIQREVIEELPFSGCPLSQDLCKKSIRISESNNNLDYSALGFSNLPLSTLIQAVLPGDIQIENKKKNGETVTTITLSHKGRLLQIFYEFKEGSFKQAGSPSARFVEQGEMLGTIIDTDLRINEDNQSYNLIFSELNTITNRYIQLKPSADGINLLIAPSTLDNSK